MEAPERRVCIVRPCKSDSSATLEEGIDFLKPFMEIGPVMSTVMTPVPIDAQPSGCFPPSVSLAFVSLCVYMCCAYLFFSCECVFVCLVRAPAFNVLDSCELLLSHVVCVCVCVCVNVQVSRRSYANYNAELDEMAHWGMPRYMKAFQVSEFPFPNSPPCVSDNVAWMFAWQLQCTHLSVEHLQKLADYLGSCPSPIAVMVGLPPPFSFLVMI